MVDALNSILKEKAWLTTVVLHKMSDSSGEEKEAMALKKDSVPSSSIRTARTTATHSMPVDVETLAPRTASARGASIAR